MSHGVALALRSRGLDTVGLFGRGAAGLGHLVRGAGCLGRGAGWSGATVADEFLVGLADLEEVLLNGFAGGSVAELGCWREESASCWDK